MSAIFEYIARLFNIKKTICVNTAEQVIDSLENKPLIFNRMLWLGWDVVGNFKLNIILDPETGRIYKHKVGEIQTTDNQKRLVKKYLKNLFYYEDLNQLFAERNFTQTKNC